MSDHHVVVTVVGAQDSPDSRAHVLVTLAGEIDAALPRLTTAVEEALRPRLPVRVDVRDVTFMDSTGVGFLARLVRGVRPATVEVTGADEELRRLLDRLQMNTVLDVLG